MGDGGASKVGWRLVGLGNVSFGGKLSEQAVSTPFVWTEGVEDCSIGCAGKTVNSISIEDEHRLPFGDGIDGRGFSGSSSVSIASAP